MLVLCCAFGSTVTGAEEFSLSPDEEFYIYGQHNEKISDILGVSETEIKEYCGKNVIYMALNKDNSKQIRITTGQNAFTYSVVNISNFTNDKILSLSSDIIGIENVKGEVVNKNGQKFVKTEIRSEDSGGEYILTEYITVADKKSYVLSFYTDINADKGYIDEVFESYNSVYFINEKAQSKGILQYILPALTIIFGMITLLVAVTLIIDIRKKKKETL